MNKMHNELKIECSKNGYIVYTGHRQEGAAYPWGDVFVFESFESLTRWLYENLQKPTVNKNSVREAMEAMDAAKMGVLPWQNET